MKKTKRAERKATYVEQRQQYVEILAKTPLDDRETRAYLNEQIETLNKWIENENTLNKTQVLAIGLGVSVTACTVATIAEIKGVHIVTDPLKIVK